MSGLLLDTHALVWGALEPARLSKRAQRAVQDTAQLYLTAVSTYEVLFLADRGRISLHMEPRLWLQTATARLGLVVLPITEEIAAVAATLSSYPNGDPADRMIVATAMTMGLPLCSADRDMQRFAREVGGLNIVW